jgi:hypothetical protein
VRFLRALPLLLAAHGDLEAEAEAETEAAIKPSWARIERNMARLESDAETWAPVRSTMAEVADGR